MTGWLPAENGFMGMGIGAAMTGLRPIIEGMNMGFLLLAYNQISNNAGMLHYTSGGQFKVNDSNHKGRQTAQQLPFVTGIQPHMWSSQAVMFAACLSRSLACPAWGSAVHPGACREEHSCLPAAAACLQWQQQGPYKIASRCTAACLLPPVAAAGPFSTAIWLC